MKQMKLSSLNELKIDFKSFQYLVKDLSVDNEFYYRFLHILQISRYKNIIYMHIFCSEILE